MGLIDQNPKEYFDKIIDTEPQNRTWVLSVVINFILAFGIGLMIYLYNGVNKDKTDLEKRLDIQTQYNLKDNKDCTKVILERDVYWQAKIDTERANNKKYLEDKALKLEQELDMLKKESKKVVERTNNALNNIQ